MRMPSDSTPEFAFCAAAAVPRKAKETLTEVLKSFSLVDEAAEISNPSKALSCRFQRIA